MTASDNCLNIIKSFEGYSAKAYKDPGSVNGLPITIGWGSTSYVNGKPIKLGDVVTVEQATAMLKKEVDKTAAAIDALKLPINQNQFDAVVSFTYNVGLGAFKNSTLLKRIKANPLDPDIAVQFAKWNKNDGKVLKGLVRRRKMEADLYFS